MSAPRHPCGCEACAGSESTWLVRCATHAAAPDLLEAAEFAVNWFHDPDADPLEEFERIAEWFRRETGFLRPGKSESPYAAQNPKERQRVWSEWCAEKSRRALAGLRAAIAKAGAR